MSNNKRFSKQDPELELAESIDQQLADSKIKSSSLVILPSVLATIRNWLVAPFLITEEEKQEAGIYIGHFGKDE